MACPSSGPRHHGGPNPDLLPCTLTTPHPGVGLCRGPGPRKTPPPRKTLRLVLALPPRRTVLYGFHPGGPRPRLNILPGPAPISDHTPAPDAPPTPAPGPRMRTR